MQDLLTSTNENLLEKNSEDSDDSEPNFDDVDFKEIEEIMNSNSCVDDADDTCTHNLTFGSIEQEQAFWYEIEEAYYQSNNEHSNNELSENYDEHDFHFDLIEVMDTNFDSSNQDVNIEDTMNSNNLPNFLNDDSGSYKIGKLRLYTIEEEKNPKLCQFILLSIIYIVEET